MKFTYYTIIGKDLQLLSDHIKNVKEYAGFDKIPGEKEILVIVYRNAKIPMDVTQSICDYCANNGIRTHIYYEPNDSFIHNLYACWNLGYEMSEDGYIFRGGSDQVFSKDSFLKLYTSAESLRETFPEQKVILQANTLENPVMLQKIGAVSRHFTPFLGNNFKDFDYEKFEQFIKDINENIPFQFLEIGDCLKWWGKPTAAFTSLGWINRVDGCSWLMTKQDWLKHGPLKVIENNITGDVLIHDDLQKNGYVEYLVRDCVTYHFIRGESYDKY